MQIREEGPMSHQIVYPVWHVHKDKDIEDEKLIGIYTTEELAKEAISRAMKLPGFKDFPDDFEIGRSTLDRDNWVDGFYTVYPDTKGRSKKKIKKTAPKKSSGSKSKKQQKKN